MKIALIAIGKTRATGMHEAIVDYTRRISHYTTFEYLEVSDDADRLAKVLAKYGRVYLLDEHGQEYTSVSFAKHVGAQLGTGTKSAAYVIGGPFGFDARVRALADGTIALSQMTMPHDLVRVVFLEQLYRALTILRNEKYHHV